MPGAAPSVGSIPPSSVGSAAAKMQQPGSAPITSTGMSGMGGGKTGVPQAPGSTSAVPFGANSNAVPGAALAGFGSNPIPQ